MIVWWSDAVARPADRSSPGGRDLTESQPTLGGAVEPWMVDKPGGPSSAVHAQSAGQFSGRIGVSRAVSGRDRGLRQLGRRHAA